MDENKNENKLKKYLDIFRGMDYIKNMKTLNTIDKLIPYLFASVFALAMFNLFLAFAEYVGRNGL